MSLEALLIVAVVGLFLAAAMMYLTASPARRRMIEESRDRQATADREVALARQTRAQRVLAFPDLSSERDAVVGGERRRRRFERSEPPQEAPAPERTVR